MRSSINVNQWIGTIACLSSVIFSSLAATGTSGYNPQVGNNSSGLLACVWESFDSQTNKSIIRGSYGSHITANVSTINASDTEAWQPKLNVAGSAKAITKAVAVWTAFDNSTSNTIIQVTILTANGWNTAINTLSNNDGSERPNRDYNASISPDGSQIAVIWSSTFIATNKTVLRSAISNDGGLTWTIAAP